MTRAVHVGARVGPTLATLAAPAQAWAHAFDDRYDLPVPLSYFTVGAALTVALTFVVAALMLKRPHSGRRAALQLRIGAPLAGLALAARSLALMLFLAAIVAGFTGTADPMMNLAPTLVWIVGWIGLSVACIALGDAWTVLDPSRTMHDLVCRILPSAHRHDRAPRAPGWLDRLDAWPSVALLLAWCWMEVINPHAATPRHLAWLGLAWLTLNTAALLAFGAARWRRTGDVFALYFGLLGRFAPLASVARGTLELRGYGAGLRSHDPPPLALAGLVIAMLSTVLFDGLLSGETWKALRASTARSLGLPLEQATLGIDTAGLVLLWAGMWLACALACSIAARLARIGTTTTLRAFALSLVPIAAGYHIAHNLSILAVQGQQIVPLLSDPLGRQWDLFGTAGYRATIAVIDARATWYIAIAAIVGGHAIAVWLGHEAALRLCNTRRQALLASLPLTILMVAFTAASLLVIAEPMVKFGIFEENAALPLPERFDWDSRG